MLVSQLPDELAQVGVHETLHLHMLRRNADNSIGKCHGSDLPDGLTDERHIAAPAHHDYARAYGAANTLDTCIQSTLRKRRGTERSDASARVCALRGEKWQLGKLFLAGVVGHAYGPGDQKVES